MTAFGEAGVVGRQAMDLVGRKATHTAGKMEALGDVLEAIAGHGEDVGNTTGQMTDLNAKATGTTTKLVELQGQMAALCSSAGNLDAALNAAAGRLKAAIESSVEAIDGAAARFSTRIDEASVRAIVNASKDSDDRGTINARSTV